MASYSFFTYDKSMLKRLYAEEKETDNQKNRDNRAEFEHRLKNRK